MGVGDTCTVRTKYTQYTYPAYGYERSCNYASPPVRVCAGGPSGRVCAWRSIVHRVPLESRLFWAVLCVADAMAENG